MNDETVKTVTAMICITVLLVIASLNGIDGVILGSALSLLGGLGGFFIAKKVEK